MRKNAGLLPLIYVTEAERSGCDVLSIPVFMRRGGSESNLDVVDSLGHIGVGLDFSKGALGIDSLQQKILKVTEQIKVEQTARDRNVAEYLKLVNNADKQQVARIRQVFEKKNQKSAHSIARLQRKLEQYHRRLKDGEGKHHKDGAKESGSHSKEGSLRDVSSSGRHPALDKVKTIGPGVSLSPPFFFNKSRGFANLIRNKYGSADNIAHLKSMDSASGMQVDGTARGLSGSANTVAKTSKYHSDDECSTGTSASADSNGNPAGGSAGGSGGAAHSDTNGQLAEVLEMVREIREAQAQLAEDIETLNSQFKRDYGYFSQVMQEERYRYERLEDQLNDLTELHQHETSNLKQDLASIEEKVAYQAYERARDIQVSPQTHPASTAAIMHVCVCVCVVFRRSWSLVRPACPSWSSSNSSSSSKRSSWRTLTPKSSWGSPSTSCWPSPPSSWCACPRRPSLPPRCCAAASTWRSPAWACPCWRCCGRTGNTCSAPWSDCSSHTETPSFYVMRDHAVYKDWSRPPRCLQGVWEKTNPTSCLFSTSCFSILFWRDYFLSHRVVTL
ncbi:transmembrane and coiled-coil domain protein 3 isoform X2 [Nerophis ophidion]|uniref:transmembrane and coiled-coil domain protein 3 isoform X2 n=1 Tax=Nerophis ophidion TaxID=159077 RepID=UPI002ADF3B2A|nr:transmembrane and coiled-coil domain protein 3 isoform X2 [Nerophis ophidion]